MQRSHRIWLAGNGDGPWPCWRCNEPVAQLGGPGAGYLGGRRRNGIIHHHDENHCNDDPGNLRVMHHGCHATHHGLRHTMEGAGGINPWSGVPAWRQLADELAGAIAAGKYGPGEPIPSRRRLHQETRLAAITIEHALNVLKAEGLVYTMPGRGTFVAPR